MRSALSLLLCLVAALSLADGLPRRGTLGLPLKAVPAEIQAKLDLKPQSGIQVATAPDGKYTGGLK